MSEENNNSINLDTPEIIDNNSYKSESISSDANFQTPEQEFNMNAQSKNNSQDCTKVDSSEEVKKQKKPKRTKEEYLQELAEKRKIKEEEKERMRLERDIIKKQKDEERRIKKEEEQQKKEEERIKREEERKLKKQEELQKKEEERVKREEERRIKKEMELDQKLKQEKEKEETLSKLRISNFFKKKTDTNDNDNKITNKIMSGVGSVSRPITLMSSAGDSLKDKESLDFDESNNSFIIEQTQFEKKFQPFYLKNNYALYQLNAKPRINEIDDILFSQLSLDDNLTFETKAAESFDYLKNCKDKYISKRIPYDPQDNSLVVFHECDRGDKTDEELNKLLSKVPHKYLKFYENSKLPYTGTYSETCVLPPNNPFDTKKTDFEYDKDSGDEDYGYIDSDIDVENDFEDGEEGEELDSEEDDDDDDDEDDDDEGDDGANELSGFVEADAINNSAKESNKRTKKTLLIPTIQYRPEETQVILDPITLTLFNDDDKEYMDSISIKMLYPIPIDLNEPIGAPIVTEPEAKKRTIDQMNKELTEEVIVDSQDNTDEKDNSNEPDSKKSKIVISDKKALVEILLQVVGCPYSKNTLVEVLGFAMDSKFSRKLIKDTVDHYAIREKDRWALKDSEIIDKLEKSIKEEAK
ncbi:hypothetical protein ACO0SA_004044 [Hanseniaspora valbyensis]